MPTTLFRLFLICGLLFGAASARAQQSMAADGFTAAQRQAIVAIVRDALKTDPSILRDAVAALQADSGARHEAQAQQAVMAAGPALTRDPQDPVAGNPNGDVTLVEFFDVRCPYCRRMLPVMAQLLKVEPRLRLVYKDIPILGPGSVLGTRAEFAAQRQGGYLKLHDAIMAGPADITEATLQEACRVAGLDWSRLQRDMADPAIQTRIDANLKLARSLEIDGTPTYIVGNRMLPGAVPLADLRDAIAAVRKG
jgi:protein-disulfide isomerase